MVLSPPPGAPNLLRSPASQLMAFTLTAHGVTHAGRVRKTTKTRSTGTRALVCSSWLTAWAATTQVKSRRPSRSRPCRVPRPLAPRRRLHVAVRHRSQSVLPGNRLMTAIKLANRRVFKAGESRDELHRPRHDGRRASSWTRPVTFSGVGDSRIYVLRRRHVSSSSTQDDSWVATVLAREPGNGRRPLATHPMRHVLTNVLGARASRSRWTSPSAPHVGGETLLLCSDGLHGALDDKALESVLASKVVERHGRRPRASGRSSATAATTSPRSSCRCPRG